MANSSVNPFDDPGEKVAGNPFDTHAGGGGNPFDLGGSQTTPRPSHISLSRTPTENPIISALQAGTRFGKHLVATGKLGVPDQAGEDRDRATIERRLNDFVDPGGVARKEHGPEQPWETAAGGFGIDTALDPTTYIPFGLVGKGLRTGVEAASAIGKPVGRALLERAPEGVRDAVDVAEGGGQKAGDLFRWGGSEKRDLGEEAYRDATLASNRQGAREAELARRLELRRAGIFDHLSDAQRLDAYRILNGEIDVASDPAVNKAAQEGRRLLNDAGYIQASQSGRHAIQFGGARAGNSSFVRPESPSLGGDFESVVPEDLPKSYPRVKKIVAQNLPGYNLLENLKEFAAPAEQGVLGKENIRAKYLPGTNAAQNVADETTRPHSYNLLAPFAGHALQRDSFRIGDKAPEEVSSAVDSFDAAMKRYMRASAIQASAGQLRHELGVKPGDAPEALSKLFERTPRAVGAARNLSEKAMDIARLPADAARNTVTAFGLKHGLINVPTLAWASEGVKPVVSMFKDAAKMMRMSPEERWEFNRPAREAGTIGPELEHENPFLGVVGKTPVAARAGIGAAYGGYQGQKIENEQNPKGSPLERVGAGLLGGALGAGGGAALPSIGRGANELTRALDEAAKKAVFDAKVSRGMKPEEAAAQTLKETIDYNHRSPIAEWLQKWGVAPFANFATKVPGAIASSFARDPRKAVLLDRLTNGLATEGSVDLPGHQDNGKPHQFSMSTPLSETLELAGDPMRYARSKVSDPVKAASSALAQALSHGGRGSRYMTYGEPLLPHKKDGHWKAGFVGNSLAGYGPLGTGREALDAVSADEFSPESAISQILGPLIGGSIR